MNVLKRFIGRRNVSAQALANDNVPLKEILAAELLDIAPVPPLRRS
jgi:hypothetical protein